MMCQTMKKYALLSILLLSGVLLKAQVPDAMTFQSVIRTAQGELAGNRIITLRLSILQGTVDGVPVYVENQSGKTNANGLITLSLGRGTAVSGDFALIDWSDGPYFLQVAVDVDGGFNFAVQSTTQFLSVPYAFHARTAATVSGPISFNSLVDVPTAIGFSGSYNDLTDAPVLSAVATSGRYTDLTGTPVLSAVATSGRYADLTGSPVLSPVATSGRYTDLTGTPVLSAAATSGNYADLTGTPVLAVVATTGSYNDLTDRPALSEDGTFTGSYNDLSNRPNIADSIALYGFDGSFASLRDVPTLATVAFSGDYNDLTNTPSITGGVVTDYTLLTNLPNLRDTVHKYAPGASNDYRMLSNTPLFADSIDAYELRNYLLMDNRPNLHDSLALYGFSGEYYDLKHRPNIVDSIRYYGFSGSWRDLQDMPDANQTGAIMYYDMSLEAWRILAPGQSGDLLMMGEGGSLKWVNAAFVAQNIANTDMIEVTVNNYPDAQHRYTVSESSGLMSASGKLLVPMYHDLSYEIRPVEGWGVKSILLNGKACDSLYYTESNITFLEFMVDTTGLGATSYNIDITLESVKVKYIIRMETSPGVYSDDTINVSVGYMCDFEATVLRRSGYGLSSVTVNGVDVTATARHLNTIRVKNITSAQTIIATYKPNLYSVGDLYYENNAVAGIVYDVSPGGRQAKVINLRQAMYHSMCTWSEAFAAASAAGAGWRLPSVEEMEVIHEAQDIINPILISQGASSNLANVQLWTSDEESDEFASSYNMNGGYVSGILKTSSATVLCIKQINMP